MLDLRGAVVAIDPRNGDVLALVSTPAFDPESLRRRLEPRRLRRADHGSRQAALQPRARRRLSAGLDGEAVHRARRAAARGDRRPSDETYCPGHSACRARRTAIATGSRRVHGKVDMHDAIVRSCDVYFYQLARRDGHRRHGRRAHAFGFGAPTGLDISGENSGIVPSRAWKEKQFTRREDQVWFPGETVITGIGQGYMLVTPIQLAHAGATLAARGQALRAAPADRHRERGDARGAATSSRSRCRASTTRIPSIGRSCIDAMVGVTAEPRGTARSAMHRHDLPRRRQDRHGASHHHRAGREVSRRGHRRAQRDHGLFVAFAPAEAPRIALGVIVENGGGGAARPRPSRARCWTSISLRKTRSLASPRTETYVAREP